METLLLGVDVGTGSARAGVLTARGELLGRAEVPIHLRRLDADRAEHDSEQIWSSVCSAVRGAVDAARVDPDAIRGIAFDATCSLVIRDRDGAQLGVSADAEPNWDTFVWLDHRALAEAEECTATAHRALDFAGGVMSPEMEVPKLMWLKRNRPEAWAGLGFAFDLADFLGWKATGSLARSQSTLVCKWNVLGHEAPGWQTDFLERIDLADLVPRGALPDAPSPVGSAIRPLTRTGAAALGLGTHCMVGVGLVDAHAGALGVLGGFLADPATIDRHLALVTGTSNSIIALAPEARPMHGIWGPYFGALLPGCWLSEGGQSAAGALLDHLIRWQGHEPSLDLHARIAARIRALQEAEGAHLAPDLHVLPDFHGNRSPLADPGARGMIIGLTLDSGFDGLCRLYWRAAVGIALGLRQVLEAFGTRGFGNGTLQVAGGHTKSPLLLQLYADATGFALIETLAEDAMLLGAAMAAASACGAFPSLAEAGAAMHRPGNPRLPNRDRWPAYNRDYAIVLELQRQRRTLAEVGAEGNRSTGRKPVSFD